MQPKKNVLLVDLDDARRNTRVQMLEAAGYDVETRANHEVSEPLDGEGNFDLIILALHQKKLEEAAANSERLREQKPDLPILLLLDAGVFVPHGTLSRSAQTDFPSEWMNAVAEMLAGSTHIREYKAESA